jgi:hypothetical protein
MLTLTETPLLRSIGYLLYDLCRCDEPRLITQEGINFIESEMNVGNKDYDSLWEDIYDEVYVFLNDNPECVDLLSYNQFCELVGYVLYYISISKINKRNLTTKKGNNLIDRLPDCILPEDKYYEDIISSIYNDQYLDMLKLKPTD